MNYELFAKRFEDMNRFEKVLAIINIPIVAVIAFSVMVVAFLSTPVVLGMKMVKKARSK